MASSGKHLSSLTVQALVLSASALSAASLAAQDMKPLPAVADLRARAVTNYASTASAREKYLCRSRVTEEDLDGKGRLKKTNLLERESFFVNGTEISQTVSRDGKPLSADEQRKQDQAVRKRIQAASAGSSKHGGPHMRMSDVLKLAKLSNERRVPVSGRPTIVFDVVPDPDVKTSDLAQRFVADMAGTVSIDEATGTLQDANTYGVKDIKVAGGLLANVHKGFALHIVSAPQPDGVWLIKSIDGQGDARVGLFVHEGARFHQETEGCRLYDVNSEQKGDAVHPPAK